MKKEKYQELVKKFESKNARVAFREKTPIEEIPWKWAHGSSTHHPDREGGVTTNDIKLWVKFMNNDWFQPYGYFQIFQIEKMLEICINDNQIISLFELLSAKKEYGKGETKS